MKQQNNTSVPLLGHRDCFYHVTEAENVSSIMQNGLRCGDDLHIYLITELNLDAVMHIAASQSAIKTPVIIEVCALGITAKLKPDNVAELFASQQLRVRQSIIPPQFLTVVCSVAMDPGYSSTGSRVAGSNARWRAVVAASMQKFAADNAAALPALQAVDRA